MCLVKSDWYSVQYVLKDSSQVQKSLNVYGCEYATLNYEWPCYKSICIRFIQLHFNNQFIFRIQLAEYLIYGIFRQFCFPLQNFVVRGSSQANTMAVSVRLPPDTGPYIEHYLIMSENGVLSLESSRFEFNSIPALIDHYAKCW